MRPETCASVRFNVCHCGGAWPAPPLAGCCALLIASWLGGGTVHGQASGSVVAWGNNGAGQTTVPVIAQSGATAIAAGADHTVALKNNGSVLAWGDNGDGQNEH